VLLVVVLAVSIGLLFAPRLLRHRRSAGVVVVGATAALVVAWNLAGQISASNGVNVFSRNLLGNFPSPPSWLDRATHGQPTVYLGQRITNPQGEWLMEFWNRSLQHVWSLDATAPGPGYFLTPDAGPGGRLTSSAYPMGAPPGVQYIVADQGIDVVGTFITQPQIRHVITEDAFGLPIHKVVVQPAQWRVLRIQQPLRLRSTPIGIYSDGWMGSSSAYNQFSTPGKRPGYVRVAVSREGFRGASKPGHVTITVGRLIRGKDNQPAMGHVRQVLHWIVRSGKTRVFYVPASPPTRVEVTISPTFSPHDSGGSDRRQLGAQIFYAFSATKPPGT
jgi:hypothetical protein